MILLMTKQTNHNLTPENKKKQMNNVWKADDEFVNEMNADEEEPMAKPAGLLIGSKEGLEKAGILSTKTFSGFGADPCLKLKQIAESYSVEDKKKENQKAQWGISSISTYWVSRCRNTRRRTCERSISSC